MAERNAAETVPATDRAVRPHLLFVDDEEHVLSAYSRLIERLGYRVTAHSDPRAALAAFRAAPGDFDACFTDYAMRGLDGLRLAEELLRVRPDLPIALASGYGSPLTREAARAAGLRGVVAKPYTLDDLRHALEGLVGGPG